MQLDYFPMIKFQISKQPVKFHRELTRLVNKELERKDLADMSESGKMILEYELGDLIEYCVEEYHEQKRG